MKSLLHCLLTSILCCAFAAGCCGQFTTNAPEHIAPHDQFVTAYSVNGDAYHFNAALSTNGVLCYTNSSGNSYLANNAPDWIGDENGYSANGPAWDVSAWPPGNRVNDLGEFTTNTDIFGAWFANSGNPDHPTTSPATMSISVLQSSPFFPQPPMTRFPTGSPFSFTTNPPQFHCTIIASYAITTNATAVVVTNWAYGDGNGLWTTNSGCVSSDNGNPVYVRAHYNLFFSANQWFIYDCSSETTLDASGSLFGNWFSFESPAVNPPPTVLPLLITNVTYTTNYP
ncbi:MAG TPA: hypothetical protein VHG89_04875 [Verrucomicrobiae bacterium]|nr:hypothetical protein [Verrucomicrobiae bacterium]